MQITVIGCGYLGATHAAGMAELGFDVLGLDVDAARIAVLSTGRAPLYEPGLDDLLAKHVASGRLRFTTSYDEVAELGDLHFLCLPTPQRDGELAAELSYVEAAVDALAPRLRRPCVVVGKSTVPVGTAARLADRLQTLAPAGADVALAWNPEFLREGHAVADTLGPDRLVFGLGADQTGVAEKLLREVYSALISVGTPVVTCDLATAELVKVAANAFLATKISFINAMAELCEASGADVGVLADAIGHDPRIGRSFLDAGLGFGGGCLPKDIRAFMARAGELGAEEALTFLREVDAINSRRRQRVVDLVRELLGDQPWRQSRIAVLGAAFKPDSDDVRDSPALAVAGRLHLFGADVRVYDPRATETSRARWPTLSYAASLRDACTDADVVLVLTEWQEFRELTPAGLTDVVSSRLILDGRNCLDPAPWRAAGWTYRGMGRP